MGKMLNLGLFEEVNHGFLQRHFPLGITFLAKKPTKTYLTKVNPANHAQISKILSAQVPLSAFL
jgi:hypothetical protein